MNIEFYFKGIKPVSNNQAKTIARRGQYTSIIKTEKLRKYQGYIYACTLARLQECQDFEALYDPAKHYISADIIIECPNLLTKKLTLNKTCIDLDNVPKYLTDSIFRCFKKLNDAYIADMRVRKVVSENEDFNIRYKLSIRDLT